MKFGRRCLLCSVLAASVIACGESGEGTDGDGLAAVSFVESNVSDLAAVAVSAIEVFPNLGGAYQASIEAIDARNPEMASSGAKSLIELGDIGLCSSGQSNLSWNDVDEDGVLSAGDATALELVGCDGELTGTLNHDFLEVAYTSTLAVVDVALIVDEGLGAQAPPLALEGRFRVEINRIPGPPESSIFRYYVMDQTDALLGLTATADGRIQYALGCFNLYFTVDRDQGSYVFSEPFGVFRLPDSLIMTMQAFGLPPLVFDTGDFPTSGAIGLYAASGATPCAALGVDPQGVESNDSFTALTATGAGTVVLEGETAEGAPFTVETTWAMLRR